MELVEHKYVILLPLDLLFWPHCHITQCDTLSVKTCHLLFKLCTDKILSFFTGLISAVMISHFSVSIDLDPIFEKKAIAIGFDFRTGPVGHAKYFRRDGRDTGSPFNTVISAVALSASSHRPPLLKSRSTVKTHEMQYTYIVHCVLISIQQCGKNRIGKIMI